MRYAKSAEIARWDPKSDKLLMRVGVARESLMIIVFVRKASSNFLPFAKTQNFGRVCGMGADRGLIFQTTSRYREVTNGPARSRRRASPSYELG